MGGAYVWLAVRFSSLSPVPMSTDVIISLLGIGLGVAAFIFLCFKGINVFLNCVVASIIVVAIGGLNIFEAITESYMKGFSEFINSYFLLFFVSALFGRIMDDCDAVRKVVLSIASITKRSRRPKFWTLCLMPFFYAFLGYSGINGFVCIFTILAIGRELFIECDIPWRLYPIGSGGLQPALILGGSINITNIIVANNFETPLTAMMGLSVVCTIVCILTIGVCIHWELRKFEKRNEGFLPLTLPAMTSNFGTFFLLFSLAAHLEGFWPLAVPLTGLASHSSSFWVRTTPCMSF